MKKFITVIATLAALTSCNLKEEFQPVFTGQYADPRPYEYYTDADFDNIMSISELAALYETGKPWVCDKDYVIKGRVCTTDQPGNFYKSFYIQDDQVGMEIKVGKNGLYNDFLPGQMVYVRLNGLSVGMYGYKAGDNYGQGMVQVGYIDPSGEYETSYIEIASLINEHILRGDPDDIKPVTPVALTESQLPNGKTDTQKIASSHIGQIVTLKGLKFANESFVLLYLDSNKNKKSGENRVFLSDDNGVGKYGKTHGITTWAMSKSNMKRHVLAGDWDDAQVASGSTYLIDDKGEKVTIGHPMIKGEPDADGNYSYPGIEKAAYSVSQYFTMGSTSIQIRTSGYCKFADREIPAEVLSGSVTLDVTGVLTLYQGSIQITVNNISDFSVNGKPLE